MKMLLATVGLCCGLFMANSESTARPNDQTINISFEDFQNYQSSRSTSTTVYGRGCCSHHGGQSYCGYDGRWVCSDGWKSGCSCR